jgi:hypothetical protein
MSLRKRCPGLHRRICAALTVLDMMRRTPETVLRDCHWRGSYRKAGLQKSVWVLCLAHGPNFFGRKRV